MAKILLSAEERESAERTRDELTALQVQIDEAVAAGLSPASLSSANRDILSRVETLLTTFSE